MSDFPLDFSSRPENTMSEQRKLGLTTDEVLWLADELAKPSGLWDYERVSKLLFAVIRNLQEYLIKSLREIADLRRENERLRLFVTRFDAYQKYNTEDVLTGDPGLCEAQEHRWAIILAARAAIEEPK